MNERVLCILLGGVVVYYLTKHHKQLPVQVETPVGAKEVPRGRNSSSDWKIPYSTPTNLFGSHPYGWRGQPPQTYLSQMADDSRASIPVSGSDQQSLQAVAN